MFLIQMFVYLYNRLLQAVLFSQTDTCLLFQSSKVSGCLSSNMLFAECMNGVPSVHAADFRYGDFSGRSDSYNLSCTKASFENFWRLQSSYSHTCYDIEKMSVTTLCWWQERNSLYPELMGRTDSHNILELWCDSWINMLELAEMETGKNTPQVP